MNYRELMRKKLLEQMYDKMSDEDKRLFVRLTMQDKDHQEIMQALSQQRMQLDEIKKDQNWTRSFGSDLLANFTSAGVLWLGSKLFGKL
jgi:hypothetical protein